MMLGLRVFLATFVLVAAGLILFLYGAADQLHPVMRQASEDALVDTANLLAEMVSPAITDTGARVEFAASVTRYQQRQPSAQIWSRTKHETNFIIYLTDAAGRVLYHTDDGETGADYSRWIDVSRTLQGVYGARTTRTDPKDKLTSIMYVAAPVRNADGELIGVLTVGQPNQNLQPFLEYARRNLIHQGSLLLALAILLSGLSSFWMTHSVRRIIAWVARVRQGGREAPPMLREPELARLADAIDGMRAEIEGRAYVERYVQNMTHEMKSPLSAIRGAAELLQESDVPVEDQGRFLRNIHNETARLQALIDKLLGLTVLENRQTLDDLQTLDMGQLLRDEADSKNPAADARHITLSLEIRDEPLMCPGEALLLRQAVSSLLDNALDFCPAHGAITLTAAHQNGCVEISIHNDGPPIPDYALPRVFERFYSLQRPSTGRKSTGLGLSFAREAILLHRGNLTIENHPGGGVEVRIILPRNPPGAGFKPDRQTT